MARRSPGAADNSSGPGAEARFSRRAASGVCSGPGVAAGAGRRRRGADATFFRAVGRAAARPAGGYGKIRPDGGNAGFIRLYSGRGGNGRDGALCCDGGILRADGRLHRAPRGGGRPGNRLEPRRRGRGAAYLRQFGLPGMGRKAAGTHSCAVSGTNCQLDDCAEPCRTYPGRARGPGRAAAGNSGSGDADSYRSRRGRSIPIGGGNDCPPDDCGALRCFPGSPVRPFGAD